eukprot:6092213-Pleurochrysis_carterae.AAC.1
MTALASLAPARVPTGRRPSKETPSPVSGLGCPPGCRPACSAVRLLPAPAGGVIAPSLAAPKSSVRPPP